MNLHLQAQSRFFALSREVRDIVYHYALAFDDDDFSILNSPPYIFNSEFREEARLPAFVRTCKLLYQEAAPIGLSQACLRFRFDNYQHVTSAATYFAPPWSSVRSLSVVVQTSAPCYHDWVSRFAGLTSRMPALQTVTFQWHCDRPKAGADANKPQRLCEIQRGEEGYLVGLLAEKQSSLRTVYFQGEWVPGWLEEVGEKTRIRVVHDRTPFKIEPTRRRWDGFFDTESEQDDEDTASDSDRSLRKVLFPSRDG